jgi:hypothetical protein
MFPRSISKLAAAAACGLAVTFAAPVAMHLVMPSVGIVSIAHAQQPAEFTQILARYGVFQAHATYGEVWIPARETAPEGWHPYPPCHWAHTKDLGWYFNDKTEWGRIVHHYGRWAHDTDLGWVWVRADEFSPGWVVWRTSDKWVGWAPLPPDQDVKQISAADFNTDKHWIFVDATKFAGNCQGEIAAAPRLYPVILKQTTVVTNIKFVNGIAIFVLPAPLLINVVDIDISIGSYHPWSPCFLGAWFWNWNFMINVININLNLPAPHCPQPSQTTGSRPLMPIKTSPPPAPGQSIPDRPLPPIKRTDLTPPSNGRPTVIPLRPIDPGFVKVPGPIIRPIDPGFGRPQHPKRPTDSVKVPDGPRNSGRPNGHADGGGKRPQSERVATDRAASHRLNRLTVPKLVRTPEVVKNHPAVTHKVAGGGQKKPSGPTIR